MHRHRVPSILSLVAVLAVAACSNGSAASVPAGTSATTATQGPAATAAETQAATATGAPGASLDVSGSAAGLSTLSSYKVTVDTTGTDANHVEVVTVRGTTPAKQITEVTGGKTIRVVEIGTDVWIDQGTGTFVKNGIPASAVDAMLNAFDPGTFMNALKATQKLQYLQTVGTEQKNGQNAVHLHADANTPLPAGASPLPAGASLDLWVAADSGYLVALEGVQLGNADTVKVEVTNVNDPSLSVSPPA